MANPSTSQTRKRNPRSNNKAEEKPKDSFDDLNLNVNIPTYPYKSSSEYAAAVNQWLWQCYNWQCVSITLPYLMSQTAYRIQSSNPDGTTDFNRNFPNTFFPNQNVSLNQPNAAFQNTNATGSGQSQGSVYLLPSLLKRITAEAIDFCILLVLKVLITYILVDFFDLVNLDKYDFDLIKNDKLDYQTAMEVTSEILALEVIHRFVVCIFEAVFTSKGMMGYGGATPGVSLHLSADPTHPALFQQSLLLSSYSLEKNVDAMFSFWKDIFTDVRLEDGERLSQLIRLGAAEMAQGISGRGHLYAMRRACAPLGPCAHRTERAFGLTQIEYMKKLAEMENHTEVLEKLRKLSKILFNKSSLKCALNGTASSQQCGVEGLSKFLNHLGSAQHTTTVEPPPSESSVAKTHFVLPLSVNYLGKGIATVPYCHPHFASLKVAAKLLSSKFLHSEIREKGGAYGGGASISKGGHFMFYSYRDPNVGRTLSSFAEGVGWLLGAQYTDQDIQEAKLGVFGEVDAPVPPGLKGGALFQEGVTDDMRQLFRDHIFASTREHLVDVTKRYLKDSPRAGTALIGPATPFTRTEDQGWTFVENPL